MGIVSLTSPLTLRHAESPKGPLEPTYEKDKERGADQQAAMPGASGGGHGLLRDGVGGNSDTIARLPAISKS